MRKKRFKEMQIGISSPTCTEVVFACDEEEVEDDDEYEGGIVGVVYYKRKERKEDGGGGGGVMREERKVFWSSLRTSVSFQIASFSLFHTITPYPIQHLCGSIHTLLPSNSLFPLLRTIIRSFPYLSFPPLSLFIAPLDYAVKTIGTPVFCVQNTFHRQLSLASQEGRRVSSPFTPSSSLLKRETAASVTITPTLFSNQPKST